MLSAVIVVLREMLEICLIIGIISAALRNFRSKNKILVIGILGGSLISYVLALGIHYISGLFDNSGQEILNLLILLTSIICITFTLIWIKSHSKELKHKISAASEKLMNNESGIAAIILIIVLAVGREGMEVILFLNGIYAAGTNIPELVIGTVIGIALGSSLGFLIYTGLIKLNVKYFFKAINFMLVLIAAGMASQAANYILALDLFNGLSATVWDSSWLITEESSFGKILYNLLGYSSKPTEMQLVLYILTIVIMCFILYSKNSVTNENPDKVN